MALTLEDVKRVAHLARIAVDENEARAVLVQLGGRLPVDRADAGSRHPRHRTDVPRARCRAAPARGCRHGERPARIVPGYRSRRSKPVFTWCPRSSIVRRQVTGSDGRFPASTPPPPERFSDAPRHRQEPVRGPRREELLQRRADAAFPQSDQEAERQAQLLHHARRASSASRRRARPTRCAPPVVPSRSPESLWRTRIFFARQAGRPPAARGCSMNFRIPLRLPCGGAVERRRRGQPRQDQHG